MIRQNHVFRDTHKERRDLVLVVLGFRRSHRNDRNRWFAIEEAGEQREIVMLSRGQRLEGADMFGCSCDDPPGLAGAFGIGAERRGGFEVEVPLDRQTEAATMCLQDAEPN